jgi:hypothetical protein
MIICKRESAMHFQSDHFLYVLNRLVRRLPVPGMIPMIKIKINNNAILIGGGGTVDFLI